MSDRTTATFKPPSANVRATLRDVARDAGVSVMTVSNVINGKFHLMSKETAQAVFAVIDKLGYRPHSRGRSLRLSHDFSIGLIVVNPSPSFLAEAYAAHVVAGLSNHLNERGYALLIEGGPATMLAESPMMRHHRTDALCAIVSGDAETRLAIYRALQTAHQPCVVIQDAVPDFFADAMSMSQDDAGGAATLARRILDQGCRHLLFFKPAHPWPGIDMRERGLRAALAEQSGKASLGVLTCKSAAFADAQLSFTSYVERYGLPDAVFAANDQIGIAVLKWLADRHVAVPDTIKVTGFNAFDFWQFSTPLLTTIRSPAYELGKTAAENLLLRLQTGQFAERTMVLPVGFEPGGSA